MNRTKLTLIMVLAITLMIAFFLFKNKEEVIKHREIKAVIEEIEAPLELKDIAIDNRLKTRDLIEDNRVKARVIVEKEDNVKRMIKPHDEFYIKILENEGDIGNTLKQIDLKKPPVKAEVKINF